MGLTKPRAAQIYNLDYKQSVRVVTVANITLTGGAPAVVDGVNLSQSDRILVTGQTTGTQNGLYQVATVGTGSDGTWTRTNDGNDTGEIESGMIVMVTEGTVYKDTQWKLTTENPITIGTTTLVFDQNYSANSISAGSSNVSVLANANVTISSAGTANVLTVSSTGLVVAGNIVPSANVTYSLGTTSQRFSNLWLSNTTIYLGDVNLSATETGLTVNGANVLVGNTGAAFSTSGNITGGNVLTGGLISATGNITGNYFLGDGSQLTGISGGGGGANIANGTSNITIVSSGGNANVNIGGGSNVAVFATTGAYVTGVISATGNVTAGNILTGGLISATGNATFGNVSATNHTGTTVSVTGTATAASVVGGVITGTSTSVTANVTGGNILTGGLISATGNATFGNVSATNHTGTTVSVTGTATAASVVGGVITGSSASLTGNVTGSYILGNGSQLTGVASGNTSIAITVTTISANYTIATGQNGLSVGPMNIGNNVQVSIADGQRWIIL